MIAFLNILQIPLYMAMFLAIRYMAFSPEAFPGLHNTSFLYMDRIVEKDPFYIIAISSAVLNFYTIRFNKKQMKNTTQSAPMAKMMDYMQYFPFFAILIVGTFPAVLNMYWCSISLNNFLFLRLIHSQTVKKYYKTDKPFYGTILHKQEMMKNKQNHVIKAHIVGNENAESGLLDDSSSASLKIENENSILFNEEEAADSNKKVKIYRKKPTKKKK